MARQATATLKQRKTCKSKLVPRLARHLGDESPYSKQMIRQLLREGGYRGPGWQDEARAVAILTAAGKDMSGFEYTTGKPARVAALLGRPMAPEGSDPASQEDIVQRMNKVIILLTQGESMLRKLIKSDTIKEIDPVHTRLIDALNAARR